MCGIWMSLGLTPNRAHIDIVAYRGPDGDGWHEFETPRGLLAFGHRRLAIIDTGDGGIQPMSYGDGRYWITYNGEIYNYLELRDELRALGYTVFSQSDTEVILAAYSAWGKAALDKLRGMFALAIYDRTAGRVLLARDRFGIKPLYYTETTRGFAAGSEIKQLLLLPEVTSRINPRRAYDFLSAGIIDHSAETMFADVKQLPAGEWLEIDFEAGISQGRWYRLPPPGTLKLSGREAADGFLDLLQESVRLHLRADVEVGSCLSGGLDSSSLVMLMSEQLQSAGASDNLNAVTARFEGTAVDETKYADIVADAARARSHAARPRAEDIMDEASKIVWHQDEPYGSTSIHAQWHVFAAAHKTGLKVMLDGQGADEILAGYHGVYDLRYAELIRQWRLVAALVLAARRSQWLGVPLLPQLRNGAVQLLGTSPRALRRPLTALVRFANSRIPSFAPSDRGWIVTDGFGLPEPIYSWNQAIEDAGLPPPVDIGALCVAMTDVGNVRMLLHWEDRNSMAHGVEARVPFLDHRLVEYAIGLGGEHKLVNGWTKWVLREAMKRHLPEAVRLRKDKLGFATPESAWLRGPLRPAITEAIDATIRRFPDQFDKCGTHALLSDMLDGRRPVDFTPWRIACFGMWAEQFGSTF